MVYISKKKIKGKYYLYAVKSLRLPNGKIKKISKLINRAIDAKTPEVSAYFDQKELELFVNYANETYESLKIHDPNSLKKIEHMRIEYKKILGSLSAAQKKDLFDRFTVNFTYESNAIEGNSLTLKDVAIVIHEKAAIKGKSLREIYETRNCRKVMELILKKKFKVTEKDIFTMHSLLVKDMEIPKGYKTVPNFIYGRDVMTTPPEKVQEEMKRLLKWYNANKSKIHPLQMAAQFHSRFENIHPFEDGNGRVERFLINVMLVNEDYPPLIIRKTQRISYFNALEKSDKGRETRIESFFYERMKETHEKFFKVY
ncbi:MAG: Fic family protein, partial [Candidatus Hodarchaeales archaeon]